MKQSEFETLVHQNMHVNTSVHAERERLAKEHLRILICIPAQEKIEKESVIVFDLGTTRLVCINTPDFMYSYYTPTYVTGGKYNDPNIFL